VWNSTPKAETASTLQPLKLDLTPTCTEGNKMDDHPTVMSLSRQRKEIHELCNQASSQDKAEKAYNLALSYSIHEPWMSLCAYNLGHALLGKAADEASLVKAERLFQDAMRADFLGACPALFRLAALDRRSLEQTKSLKDAFIKARVALIKYRHGIHSDIIPPDLDPRPDYQNMFRLAAAFLGMDLMSMAGKSTGDAREPRNWILVGNDPNLGNISRSRDFILQEIEDLSKREKDAVFFKLSTKRLWEDDVAPFLRHWRKGDGPWSVVPYYPALKLLALILSKKTTTVQGLVLRIACGNTPAHKNIFSKNKERLGKALAQITQRQKQNIFVSGRGEFPEINPEIKIYGAVEKSAL